MYRKTTAKVTYGKLRITYAESAIATNPSTPRIIRFGVFEVDLTAGEVRKAGLRQRLGGQPFQLLLALLERPGEIVTRDELRQRIWPENTFVDYDLALKKAVNRLREVLGDSAESPHFIETVPRRGYRFIGSLTRPSIPSESGEQRPAAEAPNPPLSASRDRPRLLQRLIAGFVLLALAGILLWFNADKLRTRIFARSRSLEIHSVAVLPLENLSRDPDQEYFSDGMTDALITDLAKIHALRVISRNSTMQYKGIRKPLPQIARELNVDAVVEGTVVMSGTRVRITAQLIEAPKDRHLWAETYEGNVRDVLSLQDQIARAIASAVKTTLTPQEQTRLSSARPVDPSAHEAYLRGLYELQLETAEAKEKAIWHFEQALAHDPNDALAYAGLADAYRSQSPYELAPLEVMPKAEKAAVQAIRLDDSLAEAHAALGSIKLSFDWDWPGAESEIRRALELNPNLPAAHTLYGQYLIAVPHHMEEAIQETQRANDLDPLIPSARGYLAWALFEVRRFSECVDIATAVQGEASTAALCYAKLGQRAETLAAADRAVQSSPNPIITARTATAYAMVGSKDKSRLLLGQILRQARQRYVCGLNIASIYANLGDKEQAFAWLDKAYLQRSD